MSLKGIFRGVESWLIVEGILPLCFAMGCLRDRLEILRLEFSEARSHCPERGHRNRLRENDIIHLMFYA